MKIRSYIVYISVVALAATSVIVVSWRRRASTIAAKFLNEKEVGNNQGFASQAFQAMMESVGWITGESWCMFFAKYVYLKAFPKKASQIDNVLTGSTQQSWANAQNSDIFKVVTSGNPHVGDIAIWQDVNDASSGHAAIVKKKDSSAHTYQDVEGNTSLETVQGGQGVASKVRTMVPGTIDGNLKLLGFMRLKNVI